MKNNSENMYNETYIQTEEPIFIHSLWRAGSTYLFSVFRRSASKYWCYQEPIHEIALYSKESPDTLNNDIVLPDVLRHPFLDKPYFQELFMAWPAWRYDIKKHIIYDAYFGEADNDDTVKYLNKLIDHSKGRPVIQECRTSNRINTLKKALGGYHIYLWRNPWDQWWSYKTTHYFDITSQLILNTTVHPEAITRLRQEIGFTEYHHVDLEQEISYFNENRLPAEHSYLTFYLLWCLALLEGSTYADYLLNIDILNDSEMSQNIAMKHLTDCGVPGLDLSDCKVPQTLYSHDETIFFAALEEKIHGILLLSGYTQSQLNNLQKLRKKHEPKLWSLPLFDIPCEVVLAQAERSRNVVIRYETEFYSRLNLKTRQLDDLCRRTEWLSNEWDAAKDREVTLTTLLDCERENVSQLHMELVSSRAQIIAENNNARYELEHVMKQLSASSRREQELNKQLQDLYQTLRNLQDTLVQREQFINELQAEHLKENQKKQKKYSEVLELTHEMRRRIDYLNAENISNREEITTCYENSARTKSCIDGLVSGLHQMCSPSDFVFMKSDSLPEQCPEKASEHAAVSLNELLQYHDKQFITCAYQTILGRMPDPEGFRYYLDRLRSGLSKYEILAQMRFSKEGNNAEY